MAATVDDLEAPRFALGHRPALDGVRAVAVLLVMCLHTFAILALPPKTGFLGGLIGVDVFFVLSGFLITSLILERRRDGRFSFGAFYKRRAARLLPAVVVLLVTHSVLNALWHRSAATEVNTVVAAIGYVTNWMPTFHVARAPDLRHLWSLAIEEQFYLVWPLVVGYLVPRKRPLLLIVVAIVGVAIWRAFLLHRYGVGYPIVYERTDARADSLLVGGLLSFALYAGWRPSDRFRVTAGWVGLAAVLGYFVFYGGHAHSTGLAYIGNDSFLYQGGFTLIALAAAGFVLGMLDGPGLLHRVLSTRPAQALGRVSYALYLWHVVVFEILYREVHISSLVRVPLAWALSIGVAGLSRQLVEKPFLGLRPWWPGMRRERDESVGAPAFEISH